MATGEPPLGQPKEGSHMSSWSLTPHCVPGLFRLFCRGTERELGLGVHLSRVFVRA